MKYVDLELAFEFVNAGMPYESSAYVSRTTGASYWVGDSIDTEEEQLPDDLYESEDYVEVPHKNDLHLGSRLVFRFVKAEIPERYDDVADIFSSRGAFRRFKSFLRGLGKLHEWHEFEARETESALRQWCRMVGIELED